MPFVPFPPTRYPRLPDPPPQSPGETTGQYGARLLAFCMAETAVTLTTEQLELARYAGRQVVTGTFSTVVYDRINDAMHIIGGLIRARTAPAPVELPPTATPEPPNAGPMAPLRTPPTVRPPDGDAMDYAPRPRADVRF